MNIVDVKGEVVSKIGWRNSSSQYISPPICLHQRIETPSYSLNGVRKSTTILLRSLVMMVIVNGLIILNNKVNSTSPNYVGLGLQINLDSFGNTQFVLIYLYRLYTNLFNRKFDLLSFQTLLSTSSLVPQIQYRLRERSLLWTSSIISYVQDWRRR